MEITHDESGTPYILRLEGRLDANWAAHVESAVQAAEALRPIAGNAAGALFALGIVGVGFLAVPVMTTGAAYDLSQVAGWRQGLNRKPSEAKRFYIAITGFTLAAMGLNFLGINPMKALVWAGIVQGFSTPPLLLLVLRLTNDRSIMGKRVNSRALNVLGQAETGAQGRRIAVLGDMLELGTGSADLHRSLTEPINENAIDMVFCCGPLMRNLWDALSSGRRGGYAEGSGALESQVVAAIRAGDVVMVKGSLGSRMKVIVTALEKRFPGNAAHDGVAV